MSDDLLKDDEIITVKLPRKDYEIMRKLIRERETMDNVTAAIKSFWIWGLAGSILTVWALWDKIVHKVPV
jgi:hypothetical protein